MITLSDEEKRTVESLNCEDPFVAKKSQSEMIEMIFVNKNSFGKAYYSNQQIPKRDFSKYNEKIVIK